MTWQPDDKTRLTIDALAQNTPSLTPSDPIKPKKALIVSLGVLMGLMLGLMIATFRSFMKIRREQTLG